MRHYPFFKLLSSSFLSVFVYLLASQLLIAQEKLNFIRPTNQLENSKFVAFDGASGVLLSYRYLMTAHHVCDLGESASLPLFRDKYNKVISVVRVVEFYPKHDVCIFEVDWSTGFSELPQNVKFPSTIWTSKEQLNFTNGKTDVLYCLGYPNESPTYSQGLASGIGHSRILKTDVFRFDLTASPGSSGGPVYRRRDDMLVSLVSGKALSHLYSLPDQSGARVEGPALYKVYKLSPILKKIFPNGENVYANKNGTPFVDELGSLDKFGNRDVIFKQLFTVDYSRKNENVPLFIPWKKNNTEWFLPMARLSWGSSCETEVVAKNKIGWRTPKLSEFKQALQAGIGSDIVNQSFGIFFSQHLFPGFWVESLDGNELCFDKDNVSSHDPVHSIKTQILGQCMQICVRDI